MELASTTDISSRQIMRTAILKNYIMVKDYDDDKLLLWNNWLMKR